MTQKFLDDAVADKASVCLCCMNRGVQNKYKGAVWSSGGMLPKYLVYKWSQSARDAGKKAMKIPQCLILTHILSPVTISNTCFGKEHKARVILQQFFPKYTLLASENQQFMDLRRQAIMLHSP